MKKSFKIFLAAAVLVTEFFVVALPLMITSAKADGHPIQAVTHAGFGGVRWINAVVFRLRHFLEQHLEFVASGWIERIVGIAYISSCDVFDSDRLAISNGLHHPLGG